MKKSDNKSSVLNQERESSNIIFDNTCEYAEDIILNRVFPSINDGLKEASRAALFTLYEETFKADKTIKSATVAASTVGRRHPHGERSVYFTLVKLVSQRNSLIHPEGTFYEKSSGNISEPRYNNMKLSPLGREFFSTVDYALKKESFNDQFDALEYLRPRFPYLLFTDNVNIGMGLSTNNLPLNAVEVMDAMSLLVKNNDTSTDELMNIIKGPDLYNRQTVYMTKDSLRNLIDKGQGLAVVICDVEMDKEKGVVHVKEFPWREDGRSFRKAVVEKVNNANELSKDDTNSIKVINYVSPQPMAIDNGRSTTKGIDFRVKATNPNLVSKLADELYNKTNLKKTFNMEFVFKNSDNKINIYGIRDILNYYIEFNRQVIRDSIFFEIEELKNRKSYLEAIEEITREEFREIFKEAIFKPNKRSLLLEAGISQKNIDTILSLTINRLSDRDKALEEISTIDYQVEKLNKKATDEQYITNEILNYIEKVKGLLPDKERQTEVVYVQPNSGVKPKVVEVKDVNNDPAYVVLTKAGFIAKSNDTEFELPYKDSPKVILQCLESESIIAITSDSILKIPVADIPSKFNNGTFFFKTSNYFDPSKQNIHTILLLDASKDTDYVFITNRGGIKRFKEEAFVPKNNFLQGFIFEEGETIVKTLKLNLDITSASEVEFEIITKNGYIKSQQLEQFSYKNKNSKFSNLTKLESGDEIIDVRLVSGEDIGNTARIHTAEGIVVYSYNRRDARKSPYVRGIKTKLEGVIGFTERELIKFYGGNLDTGRRSSYANYSQYFDGESYYPVDIDSSVLYLTINMEG